MPSDYGPPVEPSLARRLNLSLLTLYGLGTTIGAGIYALTGEVAGRSGMAAPAAFLLAAMIAAVSALSFAELGARHPRSAGAALYVAEAFKHDAAARLVGLMVIAAGCVSAATVTNGFVGYLAAFFEVPRVLAIVAVLAALGGLAAWGILESVIAASLITLIEIAGIFAVVWAAQGALADIPTHARELLLPTHPGHAHGIAAAALLAFYAFIGFEDMVNVAEEVKNVRRNLPRAILLTLAITATLYLTVAACAVLTVPPAELAGSSAPLLLVYERAGGRHGALLGAAAVVAMLNGALIQIIMASRVIYGLASRGLLPPFLATVHARTRTPLRATTVVVGVVTASAVAFRLGPLAEATSIATLVVFTAANAALLRLKRTAPDAPGALAIPRFLPALGIALNIVFLAFELLRRGGWPPA